MLDVQSEQVLCDVLRRESRSLLSYAADAYPWATGKDQGVLASLRSIIKRQTEAVSALGRFLIKHKVTPPPMGSYPSSFTYCNFIALDALAAKLIVSEEALDAQLEADLQRLPPDAQPPARALLDVKKHLLAALKQLRPAAA